MTFTRSTTEPTNPVTGDVWIDGRGWKWLYDAEPPGGGWTNDPHTEDSADELRKYAEEAVRDIYTAEGVAIWWADHDRQTPEEQARRQRIIIALADGAFL